MSKDGHARPGVKHNDLTKIAIRDLDGFRAACRANAIGRLLRASRAGDLVGDLRFAQDCIRLELDNIGCDLDPGDAKVRDDVWRRAVEQHNRRVDEQAPEYVNARSLAAAALGYPGDQGALDDPCDKLRCSAMLGLMLASDDPYALLAAFLTIEDELERRLLRGSWALS